MGSMPMSQDTCRTPLASLAIGQRVCVIEGSLRGQTGIVHSLQQGIVVMRLAYAESTIFLRLAAELVAIQDNDN